MGPRVAFIHVIDPHPDKLSFRLLLHQLLVAGAVCLAWQTLLGGKNSPNFLILLTDLNLILISHIIICRHKDVCARACTRVPSPTLLDLSSPVPGPHLPSAGFVPRSVSSTGCLMLIEQINETLII